MKKKQMDEIKFKMWRVDYWEKHHCLPNGSEMMLESTEVIP
jgi:hypothetical protein